MRNSSAHSGAGFHEVLSHPGMEPKKAAGPWQARGASAAGANGARHQHDAPASSRPAHPSAPLASVTSLRPFEIVPRQRKKANESASAAERDRQTEPLKLPNPSQVTFCLIYIANGFNATAAYREAYPGVTARSARELGYRLLTKVDIRTFLAVHLLDRWKALQMSGDEALARAAMAASADIRMLFDDSGALLPPHLWPDEIACAVEAIQFRKTGAWAVRLSNKIAALRLILEHLGKLK